MFAQHTTYLYVATPGHRDPRASAWPTEGILTAPKGNIHASAIETLVEHAIRADFYKKNELTVDSDPG